MSPGRTRTMSPGTSSRAGMTCQFEFAPHARADLQSSPQRFDNAGGAALLRETQNGIDDQERTHHREIGKFPQNQRQHHNHFEHPRRQAPELREKCADWMPFLHGHFIVAVRLLTRGRLCARKPGLGVHIERREGVGYRGGRDVRCLNVCHWLSRAGVRRRNSFWPTAKLPSSRGPAPIYANKSTMPARRAD